MLIKDPHSNKKQEDYWQPFTKLIANVSSFQKTLQNFDIDAFAEDKSKLRILEKYIRSESFTPAYLKAKSAASESLCQ